MKVFSIYPKESSEKAISNYTKQLISAQEAQGIKVTPLEYTAGDYYTLDLSDIKEGDVVHIQHEYNLFGKAGLPFFKLYATLSKKNIKVITTMHNVLSQQQEFSGIPLKTFARKMLYKIQNKVIENNSDMIIVHAEFFKDILVEEYGMPEDKVIVLRQGILEDLKLTTQAKAKKELGLKGNIYLIIGSLVPDHGADVILKQANRINGNILVAASDKAINDRNDTRQIDWFNHLQHIVEINGVKNVQFDVKELPYDLWWKYFAAADVVLLPYKGGIGSGIFADCIATRTPMIGSDIEYFREFAKDYEFIGIPKSKLDYRAAIIDMLIKDQSKIEDDFNSYIKEHGMTALAKKYKEIYKNGQ